MLPPRWPRWLAAFSSLIGVVTSASAEDTAFRSGPARVALIELYTSEGCSSCPPAEQWLASLRTDPNLWHRIVPVAFHVNYWDHLGWRDPLATPAFTAREYAYAAAWSKSSVYTPCFVRNGAEWQARDNAVGPTDALDAGVLSLTWDAAKQVGHVSFVPTKASAASLEVTVAWLGGGIAHAVLRGENAGRELRHEFVALRLVTAPLILSPNGTWSGNVALSPRPQVVAPRHALAAWVTRRGALVPLQAVGGWLP